MLVPRIRVENSRKSLFKCTLKRQTLPRIFFFFPKQIPRHIKSTSVKMGCAKSEETPRFGAGVIFKNCKKILKAQKLLVH